MRYPASGGITTLVATNGISTLTKPDWPQPKFQDDPVTQPVLTSTDKEKTTTLKLVCDFYMPTL